MTDFGEPVALVGTVFDVPILLAGVVFGEPTLLAGLVFGDPAVLACPVTFGDPVGLRELVGFFMGVVVLGG